jgi:L-alanine-DL-glutamate epimerase-like enolase superfamily enzyme
MKMFLHAFELPLRHTFTISRESMDVQPTLVVELVDGDVRGYGESTTNSYYGFTIKNMAAALAAVRERLEAQSLEDPAQLWEQLHGVLGSNPFAQCALDQAAHDLWGKQRGQPVYRLWGLSADQNPLSDYTIGIDNIEIMVAKMREFPDWPSYKIKLGTPDDLDIIRELRKHTDATFRVDANGAWTVDEAIRNSHELENLNVEFIEQPIAADQWEGMKRVFRDSALPVIADESCIVETDVERCQGHFHGINIKLSKCGGLTPARRMIEKARALGLRVMVGCMTESTVGISAIAQLLPLLDYVDMDGALLLKQDIATGVTLDRGRCIYPPRGGHGVELLESALIDESEETWSEQPDRQL